MDSFNDLGPQRG